MSATKKTKRSPPSTLDEAHRVACEGLYVSSLSDFLKTDFLAKNKLAVFRFFGAIYKAQAQKENTNIVPTAFRQFTVNRNSRFEVIGIKDDQSKQKISEERLQVAMFSVAMAKYNSSISMVNLTEDGGFEALMLPDETHVVKVSAEGDEDSKVKYVVHHMKRSTNIYTTRKRLLELLNLPYITLELIPKLVDGLNQADRADPLIPLDKIGSLAAIQALLQDVKKSQRAQSFLSVAMTMCLSKANDEQRILAFEKYPTANFARELGLSSIYHGRLYTQNKSLIQDIEFSELEDDDFVITNKTAISEVEFKSIKAELTVERVIAHSEDLGTIKGGRWTKASGITFMRKDHLARFYKAIANASSDDKKPAARAKLAPDEEEESDDYEVV